MIISLIYIQSNMILYNLSDNCLKIIVFILLEIHTIFQSILITGHKNKRFQCIKEDVTVLSNST